MVNRKIKICYVVAADITLKYILKSNLHYLKENGYEVYIVCSKGKWLDEISREGFNVKVIEIKRKISPFYDFLSIFKLFNYFKKEKFDIVHTFTPKPGLIGQLSARLAGIPFVFHTIFGFYFNESTPYLKRKFFVFIEKIASVFSTKIFFRNQEDFNFAIKKGIGNKSKNKYFGDGIDIERFNPQKFSKEFVEEKKKSINLSLRIPIVGIVARLVKEKGYIDLFSAFKKIVEKFPEAVLLVVGPEDLAKKDNFNKEIVKDFGIDNNVMFLGERTDVDEIYSILDVFVLPSYREGFSHSVMEACSMGLAIVATNIRGCREAIENEKTGLLVPTKNPERLAEAIIYLLSNKELAKKMGENARKKALSEFDEKVIFKETNKEYQKNIL
ncbi:MAG: glycosyltransferase family 4 protein [Candidatus Staskawiczbacteria bacterium]|nr:glycosyltransferase family 4 protein [Candidatus Staskawiczbacteria bacterium]